MANIVGSNDLTKGSEVRLIFTADNDQLTAAKSTVHFFPGAGNSAGVTLPPGVTLSGDWTSRTDQADYFKTVASSLVGMRLETTDTDNYKNTLIVVAERMPNNETVKRKIYLNKFHVSDGNGLNTNLYIPMEEFGKAGMFLAPQNNIYFEGLKKNTSITVYAEIPAIVREFATSYVQY